MNERQLHELSQAVLDGTASEGDALELQDALRHDAAARKTYLEFAGLHQALEFRFSRASVTPSRGGVAHAAPTARVISWPRRVAMWASAAAAVLVAAWGIGSFRFGERRVATLQAAPQSVMQVEHRGDETLADGGLGVDSRVRLDQGEVELDFVGGTRAVIQGPADFTLVSRTVLKLKRGTAWVLVSEKDHGFRVTTPTLEVTDYGTEFGVSVDPTAPDEVHVFSGEVEAARVGADHREKLHTGMARRAEPDGSLAEIRLRPQAFSRSLAPGLPYLHFSFDELTGDRFAITGTHPDIAGMTATLLRAGGRPQLVPGVSGKALQLTGAGDRVRTDWPGISGISPRTVEYWLKVDPHTSFRENSRPSPSIVGWGDPRLPRGKWKTMLIQAQANGPAVPRISFGGYAYDAPLGVNDGRWHHLAFTYTGKAGENGHPEVGIHIDGKKQPLEFRNYTDQPFDQKLPETSDGAAAHPLGIGTSLDPNGSYFKGQIDELKVYGGVLTNEEIRAEFEKGAAAGATR